MYIYKRTEPNLFTVGTDGPTWDTDSDWPTKEQAAKRCHYLNGGNNPDLVAALTELAEYAAQEIGLQVPDCVAGPIGKARAALKRAKGE